jgi:hypothetical protein
MLTKSLIDADTRALTVKQPWAYAITDLGKPDENRPRTMIAPRTILLHAGKGWDHNGPEFIESLGHVLPPRPQLVRSAIVAVVTVTSVCSVTVGPNGTDECECSEWAADGQYHLRFVIRRKLRKPVDCDGHLGLWRPEPHVLAEVE